MSSGTKSLNVGLTFLASERQHLQECQVEWVMFLISKSIKFYKKDEHLQIMMSLTSMKLDSVVQNGYRHKSGLIQKDIVLSFDNLWNTYRCLFVVQSSNMFTGIKLKSTEPHGKYYVHCLNSEEKKTERKKPSHLSRFV